MHKGSKIWVAIAAALVVGTATAEATGPHTVVVLLFDGFAPSMVDAFETPALDRMKAEGAWTHQLMGEFPTISLINQVSVSTGCVPEHHGIVTNIFLDPERGRYDHSADADWLIGCEHIHQAAERQGVKSAVLGWVGRHSTSRGPQATIVTKNEWPDVPNDDARLQQVVELLDQPSSQRPRLILAYFRDPDATAHFNGLQSDKTRLAVEHADAIIGAIQAAIARQPDHDRIALMLTTDHGMKEVSTIVNIRKILANKRAKARFAASGTTAFLYFDDPVERDRIRDELSSYEQLEVLDKRSPPPYWHIGAGPRVGDLVVSARPGYFIEDAEAWPSWLRWLGEWGPEMMWARLQLKATHGYPPEVEGMKGIFYAWGAGIRPSSEVKGMRAIDVHPTIARLLGIEPGRPVDGRPAEAALTGD